MADTETTESGSELFAKWMAGPPKRSQQEVAAALGVAQQTVSAWLRGVAIPGVLHRVRLKVLAGVPSNSWLTGERSDHEKLSDADERELLAATKKGAA